MWSRGSGIFIRIIDHISKKYFFHILHKLILWSIFKMGDMRYNSTSIFLICVLHGINQLTNTRAQFHNSTAFTQIMWWYHQSQFSPQSKKNSSFVTQLSLRFSFARYLQLETPTINTWWINLRLLPPPEHLINNSFSRGRFGRFIWLVVYTY